MLAVIKFIEKYQSPLGHEWAKMNQRKHGGSIKVGINVDDQAVLTRCV